MSAASNSLRVDRGMFRPGMRVAVAVSGGADSVALLRALIEDRERLGLVLSVAHVHHGIRGAEADSDAAFVEQLAGRFSLPFYLKRVDVPLVAKSSGETVEEAARHLRYRWFWELMDGGAVDAVATAHTLNDQAETVLLRLLRGAWTEGLGGIYPIVRRVQEDGAKGGTAPEGRGGEVLRPLLEVRRAEIEAWLVSIDQSWREDSSNLDKAYTRNRLRHTLLPALTAFNPQIAGQLAHVATLARDEEAYWQGELSRILPSLLLQGRPVRGGGRGVTAGESSVAMEIARLKPLHTALRRRVLRAAAGELGVELDFAETEQLLAMCDPGPAAGRGAGGRAVMIGARLTASRSVREIRLMRTKVRQGHDVDETAREETGLSVKTEEYVLPVPGEVFAQAFRVYVRAELKAGVAEAVVSEEHRNERAVVRGHRRGDRVFLRHSRGPSKVKEIFERLRVEAPDRELWPLVDWGGEIVWMQGVDVESVRANAQGLTFSARPDEDND